MIKRAGETQLSTARLLKTFILALVWGAVCALLLLLEFLLESRLETFHMSILLAVFTAGGTAGWIGAYSLLSAVRFFLQNRSLQFLFAVLFLAGATLLFTAGLFALHYRSFYAQWHAEAFTRDWILQFLFTSASAAYQFLVIGTRLLGLASIPALLSGSAILVRSMR